MQRQAEGEVVAPHSAVLLGERQAEQAELSHPGDYVIGEFAPLVVAADDGRNHVASELRNGGSKRLLLFIEREADHVWMLPPTCWPARTPSQRAQSGPSWLAVAPIHRKAR